MTDATWKTKDGRVLLVREMTDSHLMNTIRLLERCYAVNLSVYLAPGLGPQGDAAQDAFDAEYRHYLDAGPTAICAVYPDLLKEALGRGLTTEEARVEERTILDLTVFDRRVT